MNEVFWLIDSSGKLVANEKIDPGYILKVVLKDFVGGFDVQCVREK